MNGNTIVPLLLMSITNDSHHIEGENPLYAFLYAVTILRMGMQQK
jgi:hypothetical protein